MSVAMIVRMQAAEGQAGALKALLVQGRDASRNAEGCESFEIYQSQDARIQFVLVQRWSSTEAHQSNFDANIKGSGHLAKISQLLAKPIERGVFNVV